MSSAQQMLLGAVVRFGNGKAIKPGGEGRYPVYGSNGIIGGSDEFRHENGVIIGRVGAYCGAVLYCPDKFWASDNTLVAYPANGDIDTKFLYYLLWDAKLSRYAGGAAQPLVTQTVLKQVEVRVPPLPVQQHIAGILSAYDELMENGQRRIKILESMARALYREWFVHFRFPCHENHPRVASPLGEIPQGWEVKKLADISSLINRGITPRYDDEGDSVVINQKCIREQRVSLEPARRQTKAIPTEKLVRFGDVLINSTGVGTLGRVAQVYETLENYTVDTHVTIARAGRDLDLDFYGCSLLNLQETFERLGVGATGQTELGRADISDIELVVPPTDLQYQFGETARGMRSTAVTYGKQIQNLRRTRDLLLPRLLSGQIDLDVAEEDVRLHDGGVPAAEQVQLRPSPSNRGEVNKPDAPAEPREASRPISMIEREEVLCTIRKVFSDGVERGRDTALRDIANALGYQRLGTRIREELSADFMAAVRRGIVVNEGGAYRLGFRSLADCQRDTLKEAFESAIGRAWITREDAIRAFARWAGFARVGEVIDQTARSLINGLIREGRLETDGPDLIRRA